MCQTCRNKGYNDYPEYLTAAIAHKVDYIDGYKQKQYELLGASEEENTNFCNVCYQNGIKNSKIGIWAPPFTTKLGHYSSYEKGYYEMDNIETGFVSPIILEPKTTMPYNVGNNYTNQPMSNNFINTIKQRKAVIITSLGILALVTAIAVFITQHPDKLKAWIAMVKPHEPEPYIVPDSTATPVDTASKPTVSNQIVIDTHKTSSKLQKQTVSSIDNHNEVVAAGKNKLPGLPLHPLTSKVEKKVEAVTISNKMPKTVKEHVAHHTHHHTHHTSTPTHHKKEANTASTVEDDTKVTQQSTAKNSHTTPKKQEEKIEKQQPETTKKIAKQDKAKPVKDEALATESKPKITEGKNQPKPKKESKITAQVNNEVLGVTEEEVTNTKNGKNRKKIKHNRSNLMKMVEDKHPFRAKADDEEDDDNVEINVVVANNNATSPIANSFSRTEATNTPHINVGAHTNSGRQGRYYTYKLADDNSEENPTNEPYGGRFLYASRRRIVETDVVKLNQDALTIMLNEIYARHNFIFKDDSLKHYFTQRFWYSGEVDDVSTLLSDIEKQNIDFIKKHIH